MPLISVKIFSGEIPNLKPHQLPDNAAQQAINCDFAGRDLKPLKGGLLAKSFGAAVKGFYSADGLTWFTWSEETQAVRSPTLGDTFNRVYYTTASGGLRVTASAPTLTGGAPATSYKVGVPAPAAAPALTAVDRAGLRGYTSAAVTATAWWESDGTRYGEAGVTLTTVAALKSYTFTPPAKPGGTPAGAVLHAMVTLAGDSSPLFALNVTAGDAPASAVALPGGVSVSLTAAGVLTLSWGVWETRAYAYTVRNLWNEESAPSPAATVSLTYLQDVRVDVTLPSFTGYQTMQDVRIYRTFGASSSYVRVNATPQTGTRYLDDTWRDEDMGAALATQDYSEPPAGLFGLTAMPNGMLAAFVPNTSVVYFAEAYRPHSWQHSKSFPFNIRGICMADQALVVTTAGSCHIVIGASPKSLQEQRLAAPQAGQSHRSMARIDGAVAFLSSDGIVTVQGSQASIDSSQRYFSRDDWRSRYADVLADMRAEYHDGFLLGLSTTQAKGFFIRLDEAAGTMSQLPQRVDATGYLAATDKLYYSVGSDLYTFREGSALTLDWWSKEFVLPATSGLGVLYIRCTAATTITVYADGEQIHQFTAPGDGTYRLPPVRALRWSVRLQTAGTVDELALAGTMQELKNA